MAVFRAACLQVSAGPDIGANLDNVSLMSRQARADGANFIATPENVVLMETDKERQYALADPEDHNTILASLSALAQSLGVWYLIGSVAIKLPNEQKLANRSYLINPNGEIVAWYDKIHMFDVAVSDGQTYRESDSFRPGDRAVVAESDYGKIGMSICYDIRFPHLYRTLAQNGAQIITTPAAFTLKTGEAHWHSLQRARAIENGCFIIAPAQCGVHVNNRKTYGHSLIVDPWGEILADAGAEEGYILADIDTTKSDQVRKMIPCLTHDRDFTVA